jgi:hypothetical protein
MPKRKKSSSKKTATESLAGQDAPQAQGQTRRDAEEQDRKEAQDNPHLELSLAPNRQQRDARAATAAPHVPQKGARSMANHERQHMHDQSSLMTRVFFDMTDSWYDMARKAASYYVDIGEDFAKSAVEWQKQTTDFLKDASPLLEQQTNVTRQFVEQSVDVARKLLQMQMDKGEEALHRTRVLSEETRFSGQG